MVYYVTEAQNRENIYVSMKTMECSFLNVLVQIYHCSLYNGGSEQRRYIHINKNCILQLSQRFDSDLSILSYVIGRLKIEKIYISIKTAFCNFLNILVQVVIICSQRQIFGSSKFILFLLIDFNPFQIQNNMNHNFSLLMDFI